MSVGNVALNSSMRSSLLSVKNTQRLFDSTQEKLSTGYKVNTALDNPSSYFVAQSLNFRANDLDSLLNEIGQAVSSLEVADKGIVSLQDMMSQAKSIVTSARDVSNVKASVASAVYFDSSATKSKVVEQVVQGTAGGDGITTGDKITIRVGDSTTLVGTANVQDSTKLSSLSSENDFGSVVVDNKKYNITTNAAENTMTTTVVAEHASSSKVYELTAYDATAKTATIRDKDGKTIDLKLADAIADTIGSDKTKAAVGMTVSLNTDYIQTVTEEGKTTIPAAGATLSLTVDTEGKYSVGTVTDGIGDSIINVKSGSTVGEMADFIENMIGNNKVSVSVESSKLKIATKDTTAVGVSGNFASIFGMDEGETIRLSSDDTGESLRQKINSLNGVLSEFNDNGALVIQSEYGDDMIISGDLAEKLGIDGQITNGSNERAKYADQFNNVLSQIDEFVQDTSYRGVNLLNGGSLEVVLNEASTTKMELAGVHFDSVGLGVTKVGNRWNSNDSVNDSLSQVSKATSLLRAQASKFGQQLSTIQVRQDFTEKMVNHLQSGADKLVLADSSEEMAKLLALQTRQALGAQSLTLSNYSSQSILQVFETSGQDIQVPDAQMTLSQLTDIQATAVSE